MTGARVSDAWTYRGLKTVVIENDQLRTVVLADKGADVISLVHKPSDTEFLWRSPWGVRDPSKYVPTTGDGFSVWIDHYEGGWQTVVPNVGLPARDGGGSLGFHGEANLLPWDAVVVDEGPERALVRFRARLARSPLTVVKEIGLDRQGATLRVRDAITNTSTKRYELSFGHHIALGPPLLSEHSVIDLPGGTILTQSETFHEANRLAPATRSPWPMARLRGGGEADLRYVLPPDSQVYDQAYVTDLPDGWYALTNRQRGVGMAVRFPRETFRYLWYWQVFGGGTDYPWWGRTYNVGLEPVTSYPNGGLDEQVANGTAWSLGPGETSTSELLVTAFVSTSGVADVAPDGTVSPRVESSAVRR